MAKKNGNGKEAKAEKVSKKAVEKKESKPGVFQSILEFIEKGPITRDDLHKKLVARFPDRDAEGLKHTIQAQLGGRKRPLRFERERRVKLLISEDGKFSIKQ